MKRPILVATAAALCAGMAHAAEPLRPLDPRTLQALGIDPAVPAAPLAQPPAPQAAYAPAPPPSVAPVHAPPAPVSRTMGVPVPPPAVTPAVAGRPEAAHAAPAGAPLPAPTPTPIATWTFDKSRTLHQTLSDWARRAGWEPYFDPQADQVARQFRPAIGGTIRAADFGEAVREFVHGLDHSVPLVVELRTANEPRILYVTTRR